uniref:Uncharacterized protein n=1 Tax=Acrobeloides nanus TaxID=290746 RepID=A0A914ELA7_9BILA
MKFYWNPYCGPLELKLAYVHTTENWSCTFYDYDPNNLGQVKEHVFYFKQKFTIGNWGNRAEITADDTSDTEPFTYDCKDFVTEPIVGFHPIIGLINDKRNQLNFVYYVGELDRNCGIVITLIKKDEVSLNYTVDDCSTTTSTSTSQQPTLHLTEHSLGNFSETPFIPITDSETPNEDSGENSDSSGISIPWIIGIVFGCLFLVVIVVIVIIVLLRWRLHLKSREDMKDVENGSAQEEINNEQESDQSNAEEEEEGDEDTEEEESG